MTRSTRLLAMTLAGVLSLNLMAPAAWTAANPPDPLTIISPSSDWVSLPAQPVEVKVRIAGADPLGFRVLLNSVDVAHLFGPSAGGVMRAVVTAAHLKHGDNRLEARLGAHRAWRSFRVKSLRATEPGPAPTPPPLWAAIQTRAISGDGTKASDYGVWVGETLYTAPPLSDGTATGYQVLLLDRLTLELVSNQSFPASTSGDVNNLEKALTNSSFTGQCGEFGCFMAVQSLATVGYTSCVKSDGNCYGLPGSLFESLGGSAQINYADGSTPNTGYSLVANIGRGGTAGAGNGFERLTCNNANNCRYITNAGGQGAISGALILDNNLAYTFANTGRATFATGTGASATSNEITITIAGTPNGVKYPSATIPAGSGAFQVVVIYGDSLQLVSNDTFDLDHLYSYDPSKRTMAQVLGWAAADENSLVFISSIGNMTHDFLPVQWPEVAQAVQSVGGTYSVFMDIGPGDDYALVGRGSPYLRTGLYPFVGTEASTVVSNTIRPVGAPQRASNLRGVMALDNRGYYAPILSNLTSTFDQGALSLVDAVALQPPTPWPAMTSGQQAAYTSISSCLLSGLNTDIRAQYTNNNLHPSDWLSSGCLPVAQSCQALPQDDFTQVGCQLRNEFNFVNDVRAFRDNIKTLKTSQAITLDDTLDGAYDWVSSSLQPSDGTKLSPKWQAAISGAETISDDLATIVAGAPAKLALDAVFVTTNFSIAAANDQNGRALQNVETTFKELKDRATADFGSSLTVIDNLFDLILTDWGRLQALGGPIHGGEIAWDDSIADATLPIYDRALRRQYSLQLIASGYEMGWWTNVAEGAPPTLKTLCKETSYKRCETDGNGITHCITECDTPGSTDTNWITLPSGPADQLTGAQNYDIWLFGSDVRCSSNNNGSLLRPLFAPLSYSDPTQLGVYKPYFFLYLRGSMKLRVNERCSKCEGTC